MLEFSKIIFHWDSLFYELNQHQSRKLGEREFPWDSVHTGGWPTVHRPGRLNVNQTLKHFIYICVYICIYIYIYMHTHTHTHTHTHIYIYNLFGCVGS